MQSVGLYENNIHYNNLLIHSDFMIYFLFTTLFKVVASSFSKKVANLYKQSSRCISSAIGAFWNPCILVLKLLLPVPAVAEAPVKTVGVVGVPGGIGDINVITRPPVAPPIAMTTWKYDLH